MKRHEIVICQPKERKRLTQKELRLDCNSNKQQESQDLALENCHDTEKKFADYSKMENSKQKPSLVRLQNEIEFEDELLREVNGTELHQIPNETQENQSSIACHQDLGKGNVETNNKEMSNLQNDDNRRKSVSERNQNTINLRISVVPVPSWRVCYCLNCQALQSLPFNYVILQQNWISFFNKSHFDSVSPETSLANGCLNCQSGCFPHYRPFGNCPVSYPFRGWL